MIAIDLIKQQELDAHPKAVQQISFTGNSDRPGNTTVFFINFKTILNFCIYKFVLL